MYSVIEYTPGYMPDDDDPPTFDTLKEARDYLRGERDCLLDGCEWAYDENDVYCLTVSEIENDMFSYTDSRKIHDLGRIVEIVKEEA